MFCCIDALLPSSGSSNPRTPLELLDPEDGDTNLLLRSGLIKGTITAFHGRAEKNHEQIESEKSVPEFRFDSAFLFVGMYPASDIC